MDNLGWCLQNESGERGCLLVKDWIASIEGGQSPDKLTTLDQIIDGQIGGLGTVLENVVGTTRGVPLFEFRDLNGIQAPRMERFVSDAEKAVLSFHDQYKAPPHRHVDLRTRTRTRWKASTPQVVIAARKSFPYSRSGSPPTMRRVARTP